MEIKSINHKAHREGSKGTKKYLILKPLAGADLQSMPYKLS